MTETVGTDPEASGFSQLPNEAVDARPGHAAALPGPVEVHEERSGLRSAGFEPRAESFLRGLREREANPLRPTLSHNVHGPVFEVHVRHVQEDHLSAAEGQVKEEAEDGPVPLGLRVQLLVQPVQEAEEAHPARPPGVPVGLALHALHFEGPRNEAQRPAQLHE